VQHHILIWETAKTVIKNVGVEALAAMPLS